MNPPGSPSEKDYTCSGFADDFAVFDVIALIFTGVLEVDFAVLHVPGAVLVLVEAIGFPVDLALFDAVPVFAGLLDACDVEADLAVHDIPGAVLVLVDAVGLEVYFAFFNSPVAILVGKQTVGVQIDLALFDIVPVGCLWRSCRCRSL